jgi:3-oxoacyl-[acyl-carrier protein] reductase
MVDAVIADFGTVDILINNAELLKTNFIDVWRRFWQSYWCQFEIGFNMTKAIQRTFLKQRSGSIINE